MFVEREGMYITESTCFDEDYISEEYELMYEPLIDDYISSKNPNTIYLKTMNYISKIDGVVYTDSWDCEY